MRSKGIIGILVVAFLCILGIVSILLVSSGSIPGLFNGAKSISDKADEYMKALKADDYNKAFALILTEQKPAFGGNPDGMQSVLEDLHLTDPTDWKFTKFEPKDNQGVVLGTATYKDGSSRDFRFDLQKSGDTWYILGYGPNTQ